MDPKEVLLRFINSLTLCDHMGDVYDDIYKAAELAGIELPEADDLSDLGEKLREQGVKGLWE